MSVTMQELREFNLTGRRETGTPELPGSYPALLAPYRELGKLRHDFPLVLLDGAEAETLVESLTAVINRLLRETVPDGIAGKQLRQHVLRLETRMRELAPDAGGPRLGELWQQAERSVLAECDESECDALGDNLATARFALRVDGTVVSCDEHAVVRLVRHAWERREARRLRASAQRIENLVIGLRDVLRADDLKKSASRTPRKLRMTFGRRYREAFDFELMSEILEGSALKNPLPTDRRSRISAALATLEEQKFFPLFGAERTRNHYGFCFSNLSAALAAYNDRLHEIADVTRAIEIAELELRNAYREELHAHYFASHGPQALSAEDLASFPAYLVCLQESRCTARDTARLIEIVSCELPIKVLLQVGDALGEPSPTDGIPHQGTFVHQLVHTFVAGNAFVLQTTASDLYRANDSLRRAMEYEGPAVFGIFSPQPDSASALPGYLVAAAALESRVFPSFSYDPSAGTGLADRFDIDGNPDVDDDWPQRPLRYEDRDLQSVTEEYRFTLADFAVMDRRYRNHFAAIAPGEWDASMVPVADYIELSNAEAVDKLPCVTVADDDSRLHRMVVDESVVRLVRRCRDRWHSLQELGGVRNSYAAAARQAAAAAEASAAEEGAGPTVARKEAPDEGLDAEPAPEAVASADAGENAGDDPWIETPRCTTCDECTKRNPRMFAYDDNRQAFIADPDAGSYRDLVEAAETCQVAIIHPGKPRNPDEPGLTELVRRAEAFN